MLLEEDALRQVARRVGMPPEHAEAFVRWVRVTVAGLDEESAALLRQAAQASAVLLPVSEHSVAASPPPAAGGAP